jgi:imidazolonepropionase-like amidohydrolase
VTITIITITTNAITIVIITHHPSIINNHCIPYGSMTIQTFLFCRTEMTPCDVFAGVTLATPID